MCCFGCSLELEPFAHWLHRRTVIASPMVAASPIPARKRGPLEQSEPNKNKTSRVTARAENLVPASVGTVANDLAATPDGALATPQGTSAAETTPFGVESDLPEGAKRRCNPNSARSPAAYQEGGGKCDHDVAYLLQGPHRCIDGPGHQRR